MNNPGLNCPKCGQKIAISIEQLISKSEIICPACGLQLNVDGEKSANALGALKTFNEKLKSAKQ